MVRVWNTEVDTGQYAKQKKKDLGIDMARVSIFYIMPPVDTYIQHCLCSVSSVADCLLSTRNQPNICSVCSVA